MSSTRDSNLESLRIVSMLLIVGSHYAYHGDWPSVAALSAGHLFLQFLTLGNIGLNCFVLITGHFLVDSKFKARSVLRVAGAAAFYLVALLLISRAVDPRGQLVATPVAILKTINSSYWFVKTYIGLYFLAPFLNILVHAIDRRSYRRLLVVLLVTLSVIPTLLPVQFVFSELAWFVFLYLLAGYLKQGDFTSVFSPPRLVTVFAASLAFIWVSMVGFSALGIGGLGLYFAGLQTVPVLVCSVTLFLLFRELRVPSKRWINEIAATTFGVYLIHDNPFFRPVLWERIAKGSQFYAAGLVFLHALVVIPAVFIVCSAVDMLRIRAVEQPAMRLLDALFSRRLDSFDAWMNGASGPEGSAASVTENQLPVPGEALLEE